MKTHSRLLFLAVFLLFESAANAQSEIQTVFGKGKSIGGYGALSNKFTTIGNSYANMTEVYGGVFINKSFMIGFGAGATTNYLAVPSEFSIDPNRRMSYEYGQVGLVTEYVRRSDKAIHVAFQLFTGTGFTMQYERPDWHRHDWNYDNYPNYDGDYNVFFVAEPGVQLEVNVFKWMRFSPGISYRASFGSSALGLSDSDLSKLSYNATFKFGKF